MKKRSPSQIDKHTEPDGAVSQRARQISKAASRPQDVHNWLKAEAELRRQPETTNHHQEKIDPNDPV